MSRSGSRRPASPRRAASRRSSRSSSRPASPPVFAFVVSLVLVKVDRPARSASSPTTKSETEGLDRTEHGEVGFDFGPALETARRAARSRAPPSVPPERRKRFTVVVDGANNGDLIHAWSELCQPGAEPPAAEFKAVYPYVTTVQGNRFRFRGGDPEKHPRQSRTPAPATG